MSGMDVNGLARADEVWWEPPLAGTEIEHLLGALDRLRATFRWKADGLDADGLRTRGALRAHPRRPAQAPRRSRGPRLHRAARGEPIGAPGRRWAWRTTRSGSSPRPRRTPPTRSTRSTTAPLTVTAPPRAALERAAWSSSCTPPTPRGGTPACGGWCRPHRGVRPPHRPRRPDPRGGGRTGRRGPAGRVASGVGRSPVSIAGLVLAAGAGRRMGRPKALVRVPAGGPTLLETALGRLGAAAAPRSSWSRVRRARTWGRWRRSSGRRWRTRPTGRRG